MTSKSAIDDFVSCRTLAFVGASRNPRKFGYNAYKELRQRGYNLVPVNTQTDSIEGDKCFPNLHSIPLQVEGAVIVLHPAETEKVIMDAAKASIKRVWLQQGAESVRAINLCHEKGISVVHNQCILMFAEPVASFHKFHRWIKKVFGRFPK